MRIIKICNIDSCCEESFIDKYDCEDYRKLRKQKSQFDLVKERALIAELWVVDDDCNLDKMQGDDWDDVPACCNAGLPYDETVKGLRKINLRIGDIIEVKKNE